MSFLKKIFTQPLPKAPIAPTRCIKAINTDRDRILLNAGYDPSNLSEQQLYNLALEQGIILMADGTQVEVEPSKAGKAMDKFLGLFVEVK